MSKRQRSWSYVPVSVSAKFDILGWDVQHWQIVRLVRSVSFRFSTSREAELFPHLDGLRGLANVTIEEGIELIDITSVVNRLNAQSSFTEALSNPRGLESLQSLGPSSRSERGLDTVSREPSAIRDGLTPSNDLDVDRIRAKVQLSLELRRENSNSGLMSAEEIDELDLARTEALKKRWTRGSS